MRPASMSMKEWLIKKLSLNIMVNEKIINAVINHQFDSANDALANNDTVEISGFGKFSFNQIRANKRIKIFEELQDKHMKELNSSTITDERRNKIEKKLEIVEINIANLKPRVHES